MTKTPRKPKATSLEFDKATAAALAKPLPEPPIELDEAARRYWPMIIKAKRPDAWTPLDYVTAAHLAADFAALEAARAKPNSDDARQQRVMSDITSRIQRTCRALQIHAAATSGINRDQAAKNTQARNLAAALYPDDDLIARPKGAGYDDDDDLFA
ncbi:hypothetical protein ACFQ4M_12065 [Thauera mechernichensis]|uniref:Terminase small subunit n=1 Tax=Thauera mechernichensis TaxID=82788 RepID=A0ABW3WEG8_9RHOO|nr:hypothetical protein [Thauera mechernichensis]MDG3063893.1 hypothetical protein [Thauera mechernichensis]